MIESSWVFTVAMKFWVSGNFPEIAWRAVHSRQAAHAV